MGMVGAKSAGVDVLLNGGLEAAEPEVQEDGAAAQEAREQENGEGRRARRRAKEELGVLEAAELGQVIAAELGAPGVSDLGGYQKLMADAFPEGGDERTFGSHVVATDYER